MTSAPLSVHLLTPYGRLSVPGVRAFVDFAVPRLGAYFAGVADKPDRVSAIQPQTESLYAKWRLFASNQK